MNNARSTTVSLTIQFSCMISATLFANNILILVIVISKRLWIIPRHQAIICLILFVYRCNRIEYYEHNIVTQYDPLAIITYFNLGCMNKIRCNPISCPHVNSVWLADNQWLCDLCVCQMSIHWFWYNHSLYSAIQFILYSFRVKRIAAIPTMHF